MFYQGIKTNARCWLDENMVVVVYSVYSFTTVSTTFTDLKSRSTTSDDTRRVHVIYQVFLSVFQLSVTTKLHVLFLAWLLLTDADLQFDVISFVNTGRPVG